MTIRRWLDNEVSLDPLKNLKIAVIGYGIQGAAQASNMKDSGLDVFWASEKKVKLGNRLKRWTYS